jgi:hypothetical protein
MSNLINTVAAALLLSLAPAASALDNVYAWKLSANPIYWQIGYNTPAECDNSIQNALPRWNNVSKFNVVHNGYFSGYIVTDTPNVHISSEPGSRFSGGAGTPATTSRGSLTGASVKIDGKTVYIIKDADIRMNADIYALGNYHCSTTGSAPPPIKIDYGRTVAHEMGHVVGIDDRTGDKNCLTHYQEQRGVAVSNPCTLEAGLAVKLWGAK